jgi:hypothetical protein
MILLTIKKELKNMTFLQLKRSTTLKLRKSISNNLRKAPIAGIMMEGIKYYQSLLGHKN